MVLTILIISLLVSIISIIISNISIMIGIRSIRIHGSAPLKKQEFLGMPTMY